MTPPDKDDIRVATDALRTEAGIWDEQSAEMSKIATAADALRLTRIEAGLFQIIVNTYSHVIDQVMARSTEEQMAMVAISDTLVNVAKKYDEEEAANQHHIRQLY